MTRLPSSGTGWWRAQLRARQDAEKEVVRPIRVAQTVGLAVAGGLAGAVFGATTDWFQRAIHRGWGAMADAAAHVQLPALANYGTGLLVVGLGAAVAMVIMVWALREE